MRVPLVALMTGAALSFTSAALPALDERLPVDRPGPWIDAAVERILGVEDLDERVRLLTEAATAAAEVGDRGRYEVITFESNLQLPLPSSDHLARERRGVVDPDGPPQRRWYDDPVHDWGLHAVQRSQAAARAGDHERLGGLLAAARAAGTEALAAARAAAAAQANGDHELSRRLLDRAHRLYCSHHAAVETYGSSHHAAIAESAGLLIAAGRAADTTVHLERFDDPVDRAQCLAGTAAVAYARDHRSTADGLLAEAERLLARSPIDHPRRDAALAALVDAHAQRGDLVAAEVIHRDIRADHPRAQALLAMAAARALRHERDHRFMLLTARMMFRGERDYHGIAETVRLEVATGHADHARAYIDQLWGGPADLAVVMLGYARGLAQWRAIERAGSPAP